MPRYSGDRTTGTRRALVPSYLEATDDSGDTVRPTLWADAWREQSPPSVGSSDTEPTNLIRNGETIDNTTGSNEAIWRGDRWDISSGKHWSEQSTFNSTFTDITCVAWSPDNLPLDDSRRYITLPNGGSSRMHLQVNSPSENEIQAQLANDNGDNITTQEISTDFQEGFVVVARYSIDPSANVEVDIKANGNFHRASNSDTWSGTITTDGIWVGTFSDSFTQNSIDNIYGFAIYKDAYLDDSSTDSILNSIHSRFL